MRTAVHHEARHDKILKHLDNNDHLTKRGGGEHTHGTEAHFKAAEQGEHEKSHAQSPSGLFGGHNYGKGAPGAHGTKGTPAPHSLNEPAAGKKMKK